MKTPKRYQEYNQILLNKLSVFLNLEPDYIKGDKVEQIARDCGIDLQDAYCYLLANAMYMDLSESVVDREIFEDYFPYMVHEIDTDDYESDPYMLEVYLENAVCADWEIKTGRYAPYEAFVYDDFKYYSDGRVISQIGYFTREYSYPVVCQGGREWMLITPNEMNTMKGPIQRSHGRVLTFGLGLGYFAFMSARKDNVESVTIIERDSNVIKLFRENILPQLSCRDKIRIIRSDAFEYVQSQMAEDGYDYVFADIWHDPSDGVELYRRFKSVEHLMPSAEYDYWIEDTIKYYL